jgi:DNA gyrase inhibitor GyrI
MESRGCGVGSLDEAAKESFASLRKTSGGRYCRAIPRANRNKMRKETAAIFRVLLNAAVTPIDYQIGTGHPG